MTQLNKYLYVAVISSILLVGSAYHARDYWVAQFVQKVLTAQARAALAQETKLSALSLESSKGQISIKQLAFFSLDDPQQKQSFAAEHIELDAQFSGLFSRHVHVKSARVHNAEVLLEYIAPGVSNFKMLEQSYHAFIQQQKAQDKSRRLEWDLERIEFYNLSFLLVDYDGQKLADVIIPRITIDSLSSSLKPEDNLALILRHVQLSLITETLKGGVEGEYDLVGMSRLARRELPNSKLFSKEPAQLMKKAGRSLIESLLR